ncbi:MAG: hypothetical protein SP4CHLAM5_03730 [Chlamydiia bacterium]|nr:hypothetical protein [Chlamydiia bacterium]MCH9618247.1 hypothetical protein [Chlamydiia bacterium]
MEPANPNRDVPSYETEGGGGGSKEPLSESFVTEHSVEHLSGGGGGPSGTREVNDLAAEWINVIVSAGEDEVTLESGGQILNQANALLQEIEGVYFTKQLSEVEEKLPKLLERVAKYKNLVKIQEETPAESTIAALGSMLKKMKGLVVNSEQTNIELVVNKIEDALAKKRIEVHETVASELSKLVGDIKGQINQLMRDALIGKQTLSQVDKEKIGRGVKQLTGRLNGLDFPDKQSYIPATIVSFETLLEINLDPDTPQPEGLEKARQLEEFTDWAFSQPFLTGEIKDPNGTFRQPGEKDLVDGALAEFNKGGVESLKSFCAEKNCSKNDITSIIKKLYENNVIGTIPRKVQYLPIFSTKLLSVLLFVDNSIYPYSSLGRAFPSANPILEEVKIEMDLFREKAKENPIFQRFITSRGADDENKQNVLLVRLLCFNQPQEAELIGVVTTVLGAGEEFPALKIIREQSSSS